MSGPAQDGPADPQGDSHFLHNELTRLGFNVLAVATPEHSVLVYQMNSGAVRCLLADVLWRQPAGVAIAHRLRQLASTLPVLFTSTTAKERWPEQVWYQAAKSDGALSLVSCKYRTRGRVVRARNPVNMGGAWRASYGRLIFGALSARMQVWLRSWRS